MRLWVKLILAFGLLGIAIVSVMGVLVNRATRAEFGTYLVRGQQVRATSLADELGALYARTGQWTGAAEIMARWVRTRGAGQGGPGGMMGMGQGMMMGQTMDRYLLTDLDGRVIADSAGVISTGRLSSEQLRHALPVKANGQVVARLWFENPMSAGAGLDAAAQDFLAAVNRGLIGAALVAGLLAIALAFVLSQRLTRPLQLLTQAAGRLAAGDLAHRVRIGGNDEVSELAQAFNAMAESLSRDETLRRNLVADVSHELRTPLTVLQGNLEALRDGVLPATPETLASLHEEVTRLTGLVSDLQELSLAEAGQLTLDRVEVSPEEVVRRVAGSVSLQAAAREITFTVDVAPALPLVYGDENRLTQILYNLVHNALRYTPAGGRVILSVRPAPEGVLFQVQDTGPGIAPDDLPYIFDRFYRADKSRARSSGGAGLGLAIARQLTEAHGGRIWAESQPGGGTTVSVVIPPVVRPGTH